MSTSGPDEGHTVWATGWDGLRELTAQHTRMVGAGAKGQAVLLDFDARAAPQIFVEGLHIIPHGDGTTAIGSTTERDFDNPTSTDAQCDALRDKARLAVPALAAAPELTRWADRQRRFQNRVRHGSLGR